MLYARGIFSIVARPTRSDEREATVYAVRGGKGQPTRNGFRWIRGKVAGYTVYPTDLPESHHQSLADLWAKEDHRRVEREL